MTFESQEGCRKGSEEEIAWKLLLFISFDADTVGMNIFEKMRFAAVKTNGSSVGMTFETDDAGTDMPPCVDVDVSKDAVGSSRLAV